MLGCKKTFQADGATQDEVEGQRVYCTMMYSNILVADQVHNEGWLLSY